MEEIIKQIVQIDSVALNAKKNGEELLKSKRHQYEEELKFYREKTLEEAKKKGEAIYQQVLSSGEKSYRQEEEKCRRIAQNLENYYLQIEEKLLEQVFEALFKVEG